MPSKRDDMKIAMTVNETNSCILDMHTHIDAGRIPILQSSTIDSLIEKAKSHEVQTYGALLNPPKEIDPQRTLFGDGP